MRLGILGGGQLARMLALAAHPLGIRTVCLDPNPEACAGEVTQTITADFTDQAALQQWLNEVDLVTYETENIPLNCAEMVSAHRPLYPSITVLKIAQDRWHEKNFFHSLQIPTPTFASINSLTELNHAVAKRGLPAVLKTRRMGYDGKGQRLLKTTADLIGAWQDLNPETSGSGLILESFIHFEYEVSLIAARNHQGNIGFYPLVRNRHVNGILHSSEAPFCEATLQQQAQDYATRILETLDYIGVLTIEFFYDGQQLIANEMAPRVHNSGHWTLEGAQISQFENHLRAIFNWPLGSTTVTGRSFMLNCIGEMPPLLPCLSLPGVHYHTYGKSPRPGRKLGHLTLVDTDPICFEHKREKLLSIS